MSNGYLAWGDWRLMTCKVKSTPFKQPQGTRLAQLDICMCNVDQEIDLLAAELQVLPNVGKWEYMGPALVQGETLSLWQLKEQ